MKQSLRISSQFARYAMHKRGVCLSVCRTSVRLSVCLCVCRGRGSLSGNGAQSRGQQQHSALMHCWLYSLMLYHSVNGSSGSMTATFNSYGDRQISTPYKINTPEPIGKKSAQLITSARGPCIPNLIQIHPLGASGQMGEI